MPNILLATPNKAYYSETFVRDHINGIKPKEILYGGWLPYSNSQDKSIFNGLLKINIIRAAIKRVTPTIYKRLYQNALTKYLRNNKIDVILVEYGVTAINLMNSASILDIPLIPIFHGFDAYEYKFLNKYRNEYKSLFELSSSIIAVSKDMKLKLNSLGCDINKIKVIPCGVNTELFKNEAIKKDGQKLLFVGRFTPKKDPLGLIKVFEKVQLKFPNAKLTMAGTGEMWESCNDYIRTKNIKNIVLAGMVTPTQVSNLMDNSNIYVQHSRTVTETGDSEGTPVSILEASSKKLPVVSTLHAGIKDAVIHNKTGFLIPEGDYEQHAEYICMLLEKYEMQLAFGNAGRMHVISNYEQKDLIDKILDLIKNAT